MYEEYFRLSDAPFRLNPDPRFFYGSRSHNKAMAYLHYGLKQAEGFIVITGPVGAGKSMIISHLLDQLNASNVVAANLLTSNIEPKDLLSQILSAFRIEPEGEGRTGEIEAFEDYLFDQLNRGRRVLLIIDEAQNLPFKTLEELRMLSNIDYEGTPLFQVFLVGQPEFRAMIESDRLEQLRQRVIASYHLENLTDDETRDYILHRLSIAGWEDDPAFNNEAFKKIHEETGGLPRRINTLCNRVMLYCSLEKKHEVTGDTVTIVSDELREEKLAAKKAANPTPPAAKVDEETAAANAPEPEVENAGPPKAKPTLANEAVVSIDNAKKAEEVKKTAPFDDSVKPAAELEVGQVMSSSMSVLDRLRASKASPRAEDRHEATLTDVASAIAEAANKANTGQQRDTPDDAPVREVSGWRSALTKSVDETRDELKQANANITRLKSVVAEARTARRKRHAQIADNIARAQSLLSEIRKAQE